jgi:hypothetical protein
VHALSSMTCLFTSTVGRASLAATELTEFGTVLTLRW